MAYVVPKLANLAKIKVIGVGGAGQNAVGHMIDSKSIKDVEFIVMNTDLQVLDASNADVRIQLGPNRTKGLGAGSDPLVGFESAQESLEEVRAAVQGADMIFIASGMGGGTGTGAAPVVAKIAKESGALTVAVVGKPFAFEGKKRMVNALAGIKSLKENVDALIVIPNEKILEVVDKDVPFSDAFRIGDEVILKAVAGISDLITSTQFVNVDFADVKAVMKDTGSALMGIGFSNDENRAEKAAIEAINSPLLDVDIKGSTGILIDVVGDPTLTMHEINSAARIITQAAHESANIIFGANIDPGMHGVRVIVVATGFDSEYKSLKISEDERNKEILDQIQTRGYEPDRNQDTADQDETEDYHEEISTGEGFDLEKLREHVRRQTKTSIPDDNDDNFMDDNDDDVSDNSNAAKDDFTKAISNLSKTDKKIDRTDKDSKDQDKKSKDGNFWKSLPSFLKDI